MTSTENDEILLKRKNNNDEDHLEKQDIKYSDEKLQEICKKLKWHENPVLQTPKSFREKTTTYSSFCTCLCVGILIFLSLPIILTIFILFLLLWILPGFGWFYEQYAEARDRKKYYPPIDEMKPWGPNNKLIHVVHLRAAESKLPSIIYLSGMSISMYYVKPLLLKFVEFMDEPVEILSFDPPGYGASEPPNDWNTENLENEILLLHQVFTKSRLRKPFLLIGGSIGGLLAHLYCLTYPEDVAGIILLDPTPPTVFERESPVVTDMNRVRSVCRIMARAASWGLLRPVSFLFDYFGVGDFGYFFRPSQPGYIAILMTQTMLKKLENQLRCCYTIPDYISKLQKDVTIHRDLPLLVVSAPDSTKKRPRGGLTGEETLQWWRNNQQLFLRSSDNAAFIFRADYNHVQCVLDMELAANATKAILTQIHNETIR
ncbi:unnamed protein product [Rotaria sp. Silwood2]|nr:unnamed protein product [Rotaria sp. Silwood2]CAF2760271.1 unnamed protein product [Rotaria sp. Silwood2]CAF2996237.1 unnamed protein product [Rotaria sp. Silwood2]CAF3167177.1 unnamed protein product [Rotaria sp. Silwood2]CAF4043328.1 unnamed protein product [Rotaria sp. Silwood2]